MPEKRILAQLDEIARGADVEDRREARTAIDEQQAAVRRVAEAALDDVRPTMAPRPYPARSWCWRNSVMLPWPSVS